MKYDGFHRVFIRGRSANKYAHSTMYVKDGTDVIGKQIEFREQKDIIFHLGQSRTFLRDVSQSKSTICLLTSYEEI